MNPVGGRRMAELTSKQRWEKIFQYLLEIPEGKEVFDSLIAQETKKAKERGYDIAVKNIPERRPYGAVVNMLKQIKTESIALAELSKQEGIT